MVAEHHQANASTESFDDYQNVAKPLLDFMRGPIPGSDNCFDELARTVFAFQFKWNQPYQNFCRSIDMNQPGELDHWTDIPAIPTEAFKNSQLPIATFPIAQAEACFETSGTTSDGTQHGRHYLLSTGLYRASIIQAWDTLNLPTLSPVFLIPPPDAAPQSSLSFMMGELAHHLHAGENAFLVSPDGHIDFNALQCFREKDIPITLFGTALSFLHLMEKSTPAQALTLPDGSTLFETGGYKGSERSLKKADFYQNLQDHFAVPPERIINEYGMTELSSQFYSTGLGNPHRAPHWTRARVIDPNTGTEAADGETGVLHIIDLANITSCLAIATRDLAIRRGDVFELLGRDPDALPRGCSRAAEELLNS